MTPKQRDTLRFIHASIAETGVPPSVREIMKVIKGGSQVTVDRLRFLEEIGHITRTPYRHRSIELTDKGKEYVASLRC